MKKIILFKTIFVIPFVLGLFFCISVNAKSSEFIINKKEISNNNVKLSIEINSDLKINAAQSIIKFNPKDIEIISIKKDNSILDLWIDSPKYSNLKGYIKFAGVSMNGFLGKGNLFEVELKIKNKNINIIKFNLNKSLILASDGKGTNIFNNKTLKEISLKSSKKVSKK